MPIESMKCFSGCSEGMQKSEGWMEGPRDSCNDIPVLLIDDLKRVKSEGRFGFSVRFRSVGMSTVTLVDVVEEGRLRLELARGEFGLEDVGESRYVLEDRRASDTRRCVACEKLGTVDSWIVSLDSPLEASSLPLSPFEC